MRCFRSFAACSVLLLFAACIYSAAFSQQTTRPVLHRRSELQDNANATTKNPTGHESTLPDDVSGEYEFGKLNDWIEIDIHRNRLSGYITRLGDAESDTNTPLTYFFDRTSLDGSQIEFDTKVVHGIWYSFHGTIFRGDGKTRQDEGYYVLHGVLIEHHPQGGTDKSADETYERRTVNFKSMGQ